MGKKRKWIAIIAGAAGALTVAAMVMLSAQNGKQASELALQPAESKIVSVPRVKTIDLETEQQMLKNDSLNKSKQVEQTKPSTTKGKTISIQEGNKTACKKPTAPPKPKPQGSVTNKAVKPTYKKQDVKPAQTQPKMGDTNSKGEIYIVGFGWIKDCGGGEGRFVKGMVENGNKVGIMD